MTVKGAGAICTCCSSALLVTEPLAFLQRPRSALLPLLLLQLPVGFLPSAHNTSLPPRALVITPWTIVLTYSLPACDSPASKSLLVNSSLPLWLVSRVAVPLYSLRPSS